MGWMDSISSGYDDARRRIESLENEATAAVERAKTSVTQSAAAVVNEARSATADPPEPSRAVLDQTSTDAADFAKNA